MPQTASDYPAGSQALLGATLVTVRQHVDAETLLVFGDKVTRRAHVSELSPPPEKSLFEQWLEARVVKPALGEVYTATTLALADYRQWLDLNGKAEAYPTSAPRFGELMRAAGHHAEQRLHRAAGEHQARHRWVYAIALKGALQ